MKIMNDKKNKDRESNVDLSKLIPQCVLDFRKKLELEQELQSQLDVLYLKLKNIINTTSYEDYVFLSRPIILEIEKINSKLRLIIEPEFKPIEIKSKIYSIEEFITLCKTEFIIDYDGYGYYVKDNLMSNIDVLPSDIINNNIRPDFKSVIWYKK